MGGRTYVLVRRTDASLVSDREHLLRLHCIKFLHLNCVALTSPYVKLGLCRPLSVCVAALANRLGDSSVRVFSGALRRSHFGAVWGTLSPSLASISRSVRTGIGSACSHACSVPSEAGTKAGMSALNGNGNACPRAAHGFTLRLVCTGQ